jgi:organic radical activating enzyme
MPHTPKTDLIEVFSSIQGEGLHVGLRQIFIRFPGCNLDCAYCDTNFKSSPTCQVERSPGRGELVEWQNPVALSQLLDLFNAWRKQTGPAHHSFSITGGEPLLHADLLVEWLPELKALLPIYLETNGTLFDELVKVIDHVEWIAMDIKLHSQTGERTDWQAHREFLQIAKQTDCYVKVVVGTETRDTELQQTAELVDSISASIPIIIQPVTIANRVGITIQRLLEMQELMSGIHPNLRIIPQTHVFLGAL